MRRNEIIDGTKEILAAIDESQIWRLLRESGVGRKLTSEQTQILFNALNEYTIKASTFSSVAKKISKIFKLDKLSNANLWATMLTDESNYIFTIRSILIDVKTFLPSIIELLENETIHEMENSSDEKNLKYKDKARLSIVISEPDNRFSTPERLVEVLQSVNLLYEVCSIINNHTRNDLSVIACDSGSDKSFDFLGAAQIIECVKELIITLWDRVVFFRERKHHERLTLIAESLPIIDTIGKLEKEEKMSREQAEILRRKVLEGSGKFINSGAIIPEMEKESIHNPYLLMKPEPKLLTAAKEDAHHKKSNETVQVKEVESRGEGLENFSEEEFQTLQRLIGKMPKNLSASISPKPKRTPRKRKSSE